MGPVQPAPSLPVTYPAHEDSGRLPLDRNRCLGFPPSMSDAAYSRTQITLHWVIVVLIVLQIAFAGGMGQAFEMGMRSATLTLTAPAALHMLTGTAIFVLMAVRLLVRVDRGTAPALPGEATWQRAAARAVHWAFYAVVLALAVTGGAAWFQESATMANAHAAVRVLLITLVALHAGAALHGQFVAKTGVLDRMRPPRAG